MTLVSCPPDEQISGYLLGTLEEAAASEVASHLQQCAWCRKKADQYESSCSDPLLDSVRAPVDSSYLREPQCQRAVARLLEKQSASGGAVEGASAAGRGETAGRASLPKLGQYILMERLGGGGQGEVYKAFHTVLKRQVVIKMLPPQVLADPMTVRRFDREMELVGQLNHPHIVRALDAQRLEDGRRFLVMEYIEGSDVAKLLARHRWLPIPDACEIARQAALGLQYIYEHGLVHRDIKPANLMLSYEGQVKILDLGLGRLRRESAEAEPEMTQAGMALGTFDYIAPEQIANSRDVDIRADIYSLGCTLYKLLTGRAPFELPECRTVWDKAEAHRYHNPAPIQQLRAEIPNQLAQIIHRMLAKNPKDRFATPGEVAEALKPFTGDVNLTLLFAKGPPPPGSRNGSDSGLLEPSDIASAGFSGWVWELLAVAAAILIVCGGVLWRPVGWQKVKALWPSPDLPGQLAQRDVPSGEPSQPQQTPLPDGGMPQAIPPASAAKDSSVVSGSKDSSSGSSEKQAAGGQTPAPAVAGSPPGSSDSTPRPSSETSSGALPSKGPSSGLNVPPGGDSSWEGGSKTPPKIPSRRPPPEPASSVRIELNRADAVYYGPPSGPDGLGEKIQLTITSTRTGYLYVLVQEPDGRILCLLPNAHQPDNQIAPNQPVEIPDAAGRYELRATAPYGEVVLRAWVCAEKLKPTQFGVASLTERLFTEVDAEAVSRLQAEIRENPRAFTYTEHKITTRPSPNRSLEPGPPPPPQPQEPSFPPSQPRLLEEPSPEKNSPEPAPPAPPLVLSSSEDVLFTPCSGFRRLCQESLPLSRASFAGGKSLCLPADHPADFPAGLLPANGS